MSDSLNEMKIEMLKNAIERLDARVDRIEQRWEEEIWAGVNGEIAELRGKVRALAESLDKHAE